MGREIRFSSGREQARLNDMTDPRASAATKTRCRPHCKATILESASICPACRHYLRFDAAPRSEGGARRSAFRDEGVIANSEPVVRWEYAVVFAIPGGEGAEVARHVVNFGARSPRER
jgi:hypothetical protein